MARSIWNGVISFGLVSIPVKLFTATRTHDIALNQLHKETNSRIKYKKWSPVADREVTDEEIVKGYEYAKNQYVILSEEDLEELPVPSKRTVEVSAFVKAEEIDPVYYDKAYYLEPEETGAKPYALLKRVLEEKNVTALGKITLRQKECLCALRSNGRMIMLEMLHYPDEIALPAETDYTQVEVNDLEVTMAEKLVDLLAGAFEPTKYRDAYREALMERIQAKLAGQEVVSAELAAPETKVINLMDALRASIEAAAKKKADSGGEEDPFANAPAEAASLT